MCYTDSSQDNRMDSVALTSPDYTLSIIKQSSNTRKNVMKMVEKLWRRSIKKLSAFFGNSTTSPKASRTTSSATAESTSSEPVAVSHQPTRTPGWAILVVSTQETTCSSRPIKLTPLPSWRMPAVVPSWCLLVVARLSSASWTPFVVLSVAKSLSTLSWLLPYHAGTPAL